MLRIKSSAIIVIFVIWFQSSNCSDIPCEAKSVYNRSVLCVCNSTYCDTVTRITPSSREYVTYVSSEAGLRFNKATANLQSYEGNTVCGPTIELDPNQTFQTIIGFGGAITDSAGINWKNLTDPQLMQNLIKSYFGDTGIEYSMLRVPIGGTDFSTHPYAYNELPENDVGLTNFTLNCADYEFKIPMIKACMEAAGPSNPVYIISATWSPPPWMKTNNYYTGFSRLKKEYLQTFADYHYKFLEKYAEQNISVWGITTTNEPLDASVNYATFVSNINSLGWNLDDMAKWIEYHLGPTIRNSTFKDVKILSGDDQRFTITLYWNMLVTGYPGTLKYLDGVAVHWYEDSYVPASILSKAMVGYEDKILLATEACAGTSGTTVDLGSWERAEKYALSIIEDLINNASGWLDWNVCLNSDGGPHWAGVAVDSPIIVNPEAGEFYKQPMFYAMGHFSKFVPRGSQRIKVNVTKGRDIQTIAFLTPKNTVVVVLYNKGNEITVRIRLGDKEAVILVDANSLTTFEMLNE